jgi:hypothetical protein
VIHHLVTILSEIKSDGDRQLADHILAFLRGLKLSRNLDLAESAIRAERDLTQRLGKPTAIDRNSHREEPAHA